MLKVIWNHKTYHNNLGPEFGGVPSYIITFTGNGSFKYDLGNILAISEIITAIIINASIESYSIYKSSQSTYSALNEGAIKMIENFQPQSYGNVSLITHQPQYSEQNRSRSDMAAPAARIDTRILKDQFPTHNYPIKSEQFGKGESNQIKLNIYFLLRMYKTTEIGYDGLLILSLRDNYILCLL